jgi:hypothetical protein
MYNFMILLVLFGRIIKNAGSLFCHGGNVVFVYIVVFWNEIREERVGAFSNYVTVFVQL